MRIEYVIAVIAGLILTWAMWNEREFVLGQAAEADVEDTREFVQPEFDFF